MNVRRLVLDVDKAIARPSIPDLAEAISQVPGVQAVNITVTEIDIETVGFNVTIEGENLGYETLARAIDRTGAVVHSIDQLVAGDRIIDEIRRERGRRRARSLGCPAASCCSSRSRDSPKAC